MKGLSVNSSDAKLSVDGLTKRYGDFVAIESTHLEVKRGEFLTLLGPSGSGKTTLLQMISGLVPPSAGRLYIDSKDETDTPVHKRDIGLVFQQYALFPHLTVEENVAFPLKMRGMSGSSMAKQVAEALGMVRLEGFSRRFPRELSGGQQQRVALARCFVYRPAVILMDEPLGALDKKLRDHMQIEIKRIHRQTGATIVYVTHDQEEALALSDRICLMNHAKIEQIGAPHEIYGRPRTAFAADFIGISNIFRGRIAHERGHAYFETSHGRYRLDGTHPQSDGELALVVRPEFLSIEREHDNAFDGRVEEVVYAGPETRVLVKIILGGDLVTVRVQSGSRVPNIGEQLRIGWPTEAAVLVSP